MRRSMAMLASVFAFCAAALPSAAPAANAQEVDPLELAITVLQALGTVVPDDLPDPISLVDPLNPECDPLDTAQCLFPFPSDRYTVEDPSTPTGRRVDLPLLGMPRNVAELPMNPAEWNRNDGFSPGSTLLTFVPGLDLVQTFGIADRPARYQQQLTDPAMSLAADAPIVVIDADSGERHPYFAELDTHPSTPSGARTLIVRPMRNFLDGHRYVIGLRDLQTAGGDAIDAGPEFRALRDGTASGARQAHYDEAVFPVLAAAGVARHDLVLAWDLTIASTENLTGRLLSMRDETFADLGDTDLDDGIVQGEPPAYAITSVVDVDDPADPTLRTIEGTIQVPNYLTLPDDAAIDVPELGTVPLPGARLNYANPLNPGAGDLPVVNPLDPIRDVDFVCVIPRTVADTETSAVPVLYGHGLLGSRTEASGSSTTRLRESGHAPCSVDWTGMATGDLPNVATILADLGQFPSLADRLQQGFLEFLVLGRALAHPQGLVADPAFDVAGTPAIDPERLVYDGNSQGGILGGGLAAFGVDFTRVSLGVPGMNYATLLNRSTDWEGVYGELMYAFYPNKAEQQLLFNLIQMLWDRGETNGVANHIASDPLPDTPVKQVLMQVAFGDHQVANVSAEVMARSLGATRIAADLPDCRHWAVDQYWGFPTHDAGMPESAVLAYYDSGTPTPPNGNVSPAGLGDDPHGDPRKDPLANDQKVEFFATGLVPEPHGGAHAITDRWMERAGSFASEVAAQVDDGCLSFLATDGAVPLGPASPFAPGRPSPAVASPSTPSLPATGGGADLLPVGLGLSVMTLVVAVARRRRTRPGGSR